MSNAAAANTNTLQIMEELDAPQSIREVERAIVFLASDKTPGKNGISPEVVKAGKDTSAIVLHHLHQCWTEGTLRQNMREST